jgi:hypothetical protein
MRWNLIDLCMDDVRWDTDVRRIEERTRGMAHSWRQPTRI